MTDDARDTLPLAGRHAVVTGAGHGIGAAIARMLAADGASLTLLGRRREPLVALADTLDARTTIVTADVSDVEAVRRAFEMARAERGPVTILVNNAGQAESAPFKRTTQELWDRMLAVNLCGTFHCTQAALSDLVRSSDGRVINIASTAGQRGYAYVSAYSAAKHGVVGLTRSLALELANTGVTVNAVCPGFTETEMLKESIAEHRGARRVAPRQPRAPSSRRPIRRAVSCSLTEVAAAVRWLCSDVRTDRSQGRASPSPAGR